MTKKIIEIVVGVIISVAATFLIMFFSYGTSIAENRTKIEGLRNSEDARHEGVNALLKTMADDIRDTKNMVNDLWKYNAERRK